MIDWKDGRPREPLPIDLKLSEILELLNKNQVVICQADTGAGKTTRIAQALLLENLERNIILTQPRRNACRWNARRIADEMGCRLGELVGLYLHGERLQVTQATRLTLIVEQTLINRIKDKDELLEGVLIIDEVHERTIEAELLLGLIRTKLIHSPKTKILLMSATVDTEKFSEFFYQAPVIQVEGRCYPVIEKINLLKNNEHHVEAALRAAIEVRDKFLNKSLYLKNEKGKCILVEKGTVIVLLPGKEDIEFVKKSLLIKEYNEFLQVLTCHGQLSSQEQNLIQTKVPLKTIRFVCGTSILRSSVTLPNTIGVIDSLHVKKRIVNEKGVKSLVTVLISKAEAKQAKGRAGRTQPGFYIPASFFEEYKTLKDRQPAIMFESLEKISLDLAFLNHSIRNFTFIDAPPLEKIEFAMQRLQLIGALNKEEKITELGKKLNYLPMDPDLGKILIEAHTLGVLGEAIILTSLLVEEQFFLPKHKTARTVWAGHSENDFVAIVKAYRTFKKFEQKMLKSDQFSWCQANGINLKSLRLAEERMNDIWKKLPDDLKKYSFVKERVFDEDALTKAFLSGKMDHLGILNEEVYKGKFGIFKLSMESFCPKNTPLILIESVTKLDSLQLARYAAPISFNMIIEMYPDLCFRVKTYEFCYGANNQLMEKELIYFQDIRIAEIQVATNENFKIGKFYPDILKLPKLEYKLVKNMAVVSAFLLYDEYHRIEFPLFIDKLTMPKVVLKRNRLMLTDLKDLLLKPITLPAGQPLKVDLVELGRNVFLTWDGKGRTLLKKQNLMQFDLTGVSLVKADLFGSQLYGTNFSQADLTETLLYQTDFDHKTVFPLESFAHFLSEHVLSNFKILNQALSRLALYSMKHPQQSYIQDCVVRQLITHAQTIRSTILLKALYVHAFVRKDGWFDPDCKEETPAQTKIRAAIQSIDQ